MDSSSLLSPAVEHTYTIHVYFDDLRALPSFCAMATASTAFALTSSPVAVPACAGHRNPKTDPHPRLQDFTGRKKTLRNTGIHKIAWRQESGGGDKFWLLGALASSALVSSVPKLLMPVV